MVAANIPKSETKPRAVAWDVVFSMLDELRQTHDVTIDSHGVTVTHRDPFASGACVYYGPLDSAIRRAWAGEPPDAR